MNATVRSVLPATSQAALLIRKQFPRRVRVIEHTQIPVVVGNLIWLAISCESGEVQAGSPMLSCCCGLDLRGMQGTDLRATLAPVLMAGAAGQAEHGNEFVSPASVLGRPRDLRGSRVERHGRDAVPSDVFLINWCRRRPSRFYSLGPTPLEASSGRPLSTRSPGRARRSRQSSACRSC